MFPLFLKRIDVLALRLSVVFRRLFRLDSFCTCWRQAVTPIPKGPPSSSFANYRPISITHILSTVFECLLSVHLGRLVECRGVLPTTQFAYRKGLCTCDALLCVAYTLQSALERGRRLKLFRPISITSVLSKVFERLLSVRLGRFMKRSGVLPTT